MQTLFGLLFVANHAHPSLPPTHTHTRVSTSTLLRGGSHGSLRDRCGVRCGRVLPRAQKAKADAELAAKTKELELKEKELELRAREADLKAKAAETSRSGGSAASAPAPSGALVLPDKLSFEGVKDLQALHSKFTAELDRLSDCMDALEEELEKRGAPVPKH